MRVSVQQKKKKTKREKKNEQRVKMYSRAV